MLESFRTKVRIKHPPKQRGKKDTQKLYTTKPCEDSRIQQGCLISVHISKRRPWKKQLSIEHKIEAINIILCHNKFRDKEQSLKM